MTLFGDVLKRYLEQSRMPVKEFAHKSGIGRSTVYRYFEKPGSRPRERATVLRFAAVLKLTREETDRLLRAAGYTLLSSPEGALIEEGWERLTILTDGIHELEKKTVQLREALEKMEKTFVHVGTGEPSVDYPVKFPEQVAGLGATHRYLPTDTINRTTLKVTHYFLPRLRMMGIQLVGERGILPHPTDMVKIPSMHKLIPEQYMKCKEHDKGEVGLRHFPGDSHEWRQQRDERRRQLWRRLRDLMKDFFTGYHDRIYKPVTRFFADPTFPAITKHTEGKAVAAYYLYAAMWFLGYFKAQFNLGGRSEWDVDRRTALVDICETLLWLLDRYYPWLVDLDADGPDGWREEYRYARSAARDLRNLCFSPGDYPERVLRWKESISNFVKFWDDLVGAMEGERKPES